MRLLLVEDEKKLGQMIKDGLEAKGYAVDHLKDGQRAKNRLQLNYAEYDLVILDLSLPSKGGFEICKEIREANIATPIIILTANNDVKSKVSLLNVGADDYVVKPFEFEELLSRIRAITRRPKQVLPTELRVLDVALNPATQKVSRSGKEIKFTLREFRMLEFFMRNPDVVLTREDIFSNIWDFDYSSFSNVLDVFVNKIRNKIDKGRQKKLIETIHGVGYRLNTHS